MHRPYFGLLTFLIAGISCLHLPRVAALAISAVDQAFADQDHLVQKTDQTLKSNGMVLMPYKPV